MKHTILSLASAAALMGALAPAYATSTFHLVVPLSARTQAQEPAEPIVVSLTGAALPKATVSKAYSESLRPYLSVTGDAAFDTAAARWRLADGTLPAGLALDATTGAVAGTPTAKTTSPASFTVLATYKGSDGQAVYTIEVGGEVLNVRKISAGGNHTCAISDTGGVKCWGFNASGQLGDNSTTNRLTPVDVVGLSSEVASVAAGYSHTCAVTTEGSVKCWGLNSSGQLGDNSTTPRSAPVDVVGLSSGVASVAAGFGENTCAVTSLGAAKCWGANDYGQLGDSSRTNRLTPVDVAGLSSGVASISLSGAHTCAVTSTGAAKCWGYNVYGQLGDNSTTNRLTPVNVVGLDSVVGISGGRYHTCAVTSGGAAKCWGYNNYGQLGDNSTTPRLTPVAVVGLNSGVAGVAVGGFHTCAMTTSGAAKCWGYNYYGQLGDNRTVNRNTPVDVVGLSSGVAGITTGDQYTCALMTAGAPKCWGRNIYGQLGDNTINLRQTPVDVQGF